MVQKQPCFLINISFILGSVCGGLTKAGARFRAHGNKVIRWENTIAIMEGKSPSRFLQKERISGQHDWVRGFSVPSHNWPVLRGLMLVDTKLFAFRRFHRHGEWGWFLEALDPEKKNKLKFDWHTGLFSSYPQAQISDDHAQKKDCQSIHHPSGIFGSLVGWYSLISLLKKRPPALLNMAGPQ